MADSSVQGNYFVPHPKHAKVGFFPIHETPDILWSVVVFFAFQQLGEAMDSYGSIAWVVGLGFWLLTMWPVVPSKDERLYYLVFIAWVLELGYILRKGKVWAKGMREKFPYEVHGIGPMGLIYNLRKRTYNMVFYTQGSKISTFNLLGQMGQNSQMAQIIRRASASTGLKGLEITFAYDVRPEDPFAVRYVLAEMGNVNVMVPHALAAGIPEDQYTAEDRRYVKLRQVANEMEAMALNAAKVTMSITVTIKDNRKFQKILKEGYAYSHDIRRQTIGQVRNTLSALLTTVCEDPVMLDVEQAEEHIRVMRDIAHAQEYYTEKMLEKARREEEHLNDPAAELFGHASRTAQLEKSDVSHAPSEHITAYHDCLAMDGTYATTIKLTEFPLDQPPVNYLRDYSEIFNIPAPYFTLTIMGKTKKGSMQYFVKDRSSSVSGTIREMSGTERSSVAAEEAAAKEDEELRRMRASYTIDLVPSVTILSDDRDEMELNVLNTLGLLTEKEFGPVRETGRFRQMREVLPALMHIPG